MDAVAPGDAGRDGRSGSSRENRERSNTSSKTSAANSNSASATIDYVRDGALAAHKRGLSGNLLSKLGFAKNSGGNSAISPEPAKGGYGQGHGYAGHDSVTSHPSVHDAEAAGRAAMSAIGSVRRSSTAPLSSMSAGLLATRSRKGSLRKNILRKGSMQRMETILSPRMESRMSNSTDDSNEGSSMMSPTSPEGGDLDDDYPTPRASYDRERDGVYAAGRAATMSAAGGNRGLATQRERLWLDGNLPDSSIGTGTSVGSLSRSSTLRDASTTDEDEKPPGSSSSNASSGLLMMGPGPKRSSIITDSYFPPQPDAIAASLRRRPSPMKSSRITKSSPLSALPLDAASTGPMSPEIVDYGETEWWGWIILIATWITFVVGMGSCFGAWSWAWDVGETPYAPPELEDDPTLPIVGYYPALIVLTGVMAWVWVIIAWVGMKYFKHAKMSGDDG